jgi:hypothetical protein
MELWREGRKQHISSILWGLAESLDHKSNKRNE